ncbi:hypothetical protein PPACK8108_LOCUS25587 [Phakopsora pachyrhizi]|uniref:Uncharacterized protein n=1 Tax=Phakopsora pachyrhizi TaxID=170000 RepID=A0AAV0BV05_PHAPC|nr:hypothetical protein PPACK8108_LOCUS25587 [Phakopsora pachyrhizi]
METGKVTALLRSCSKVWIGQGKISRGMSALAHDPVQSLLAIGTTTGSLHVYGSAGVQVSWTNSPSHSIKLLSFKSGSPLICCVGQSE